MSTLPTEDELTGSTVTNAQMKTRFASIRNYLATLLGTDSNDKTAARTALGVPGIDNANTWGSANIAPPAALPMTVGTVTLDFATANNFAGTITGDITLANPSNIVAGQSGMIEITNAATPYTISYGSCWKAPSANLPSLTDAGNAVDVLGYYVKSPTEIIITSLGDIQ